MIEPAEIFTEVDARRPLHRQARAKAAFVGREVDWALRFADGYEELPGYARVLFRSRPGDLTYVAVTVPLADCPWLALLRRGQPVQVHGRIADVGATSIELKDASLLQLVESAR